MSLRVVVAAASLLLFSAAPPPDLSDALRRLQSATLQPVAPDIGA